jgi:hypothetical protein
MFVGSYTPAGWRSESWGCQLPAPFVYIYTHTHTLYDVYMFVCVHVCMYVFNVVYVYTYVCMYTDGMYVCIYMLRPN